MTNDDIERLALEAGFSLKEQYDGSMSLNEYVFRFAQLLLATRKMEVESLSHEIELLKLDCQRLYLRAISQRDDAIGKHLVLIERTRGLLDTSEKACQYIEGVKAALEQLGARTGESTVCHISVELRDALDQWARPQ